MVVSSVLSWAKLAPPFAEQAWRGEQDHGVDVAHLEAEHRGRQQITLEQLDSLPDQARRQLALAAEHDNVVPMLSQHRHEGVANEPGPTKDQDFHAPRR